MFFGDGIAFVEPETAAQMICGALSPAEWRHALGDVSVVGRTVYGDSATGACVVTSGSLQVELSMIQLNIASVGGADEKVAGHSVRFGTSSSGRIADAAAALLPVGEQDIPAQQRVFANPVLRVVAEEKDFDVNPDLPRLLRRLLPVLLPRLTNDGPHTPVEDIQHGLAFSPTDLIPGVAIYDLPATVQSLVLCTLVLRVTGIAPPPEAILVNSVAECNVGKPEHIFAKVDRFLPPVQQQFMIAGHAAQISDLGVQIDLLTLTSKNERDSHIALRLDRRSLEHEPDRLRVWAEKVATPMLNA